ncbi:MAG: hypothetical protein E7448_07645 [Ruminococcaceae bacterium]|nr:hypothetical protein [Oscillospiraceae bacterium]
MDAMDKETQAELDRLEREIWLDNKDLTEIMADDVLKDLDALLSEETVDQPAEEEAVPEKMAPLEIVRETTAVESAEAEKENTEEVAADDTEDKTEEETTDEDKKDGLTIGLLITASALCIGIIGVMIYWLETFL